MFLGIIPARGGSKGVPRKNIRILNGRPLIAHTILEASKSRLLDHCIVSTDDEEVATIAREHGATVPFLRPAALANDSAPTWPTLVHAIQHVEAEMGVTVDAVVTLQPTTPFRLAEDIDGALDVFKDQQPSCSSVISVCREVSRHPLTLYVAAQDQTLRPLIPDPNHTTRRQEFPPVFWRNGAVYVSRRDLLIEHNRVVSENPGYFEMPQERSINIDSMRDFLEADFWLQRATQGR